MSAGSGVRAAQVLVAPNFWEIKELNSVLKIFCNHLSTDSCVIVGRGTLAKYGIIRVQFIC